MLINRFHSIFNIGLKKNLCLFISYYDSMMLINYYLKINDSFKSCNLFLLMVNYCDIDWTRVSKDDINYISTR